MPFAPAHALEASGAGAVTTAADLGLNRVTKAPLPTPTTSIPRDTIREQTPMSTAQLSASCLWMYRLTEKIPESNISNPEKQAWISAKVHPNWSGVRRPHVSVFLS